MPVLRGVVAGMDCANCVAKVRKNLENTPGIKDVKLNLVSTKLIVEYNSENTSEKDIIKIIKKAGYGFDHTYVQKSFFNLKHNKNLIFFIVGAIFLVTALIIDSLNVQHYHPLFYIPVIVVGGIPVYTKAFNSLRARTFDIDLLMVLAIIGAMIIEQWEEAAEIIVLFTLAKLLEAFSMDKARQSIRSLMDLTPPTAIRLIKGKKHETVPLEDLIVGDRVSVKPGGKIPIDGKIDWGNTNVDQSPITGESTPIVKTVGDQVFSGSINLDGYIIIRVTRMPQESTVARIRLLIEDAEQQKSKRELFIQRFAKYYTPIMVGVALLVFLVPGVFLNIPIDTETLRYWLYQSLVILVISCPCALVLSTPITVVTAITRASKRGVLIKGGKFLEALSDVDTVAMDKTGTLSTGNLRAYKVEALEGYSKQEIIEIAYGLEYHSEHKIAQAIIDLGERNNSRLFGYKDVKILPGMGIKGTRKDTNFYLGNEALVDKVLTLESCDYEKVIAHIHMSDELRLETKMSIEALKDIGITNIVMLTGDNEEVASKIASELGIDYRAELLPEDKMQYVKEVKDNGQSITMIGDGINDAPALALSDVGIAMGVAGTAIAIETADIVLASDDLFSLPYLFKLSKETQRTIRINIFLSLFIKLSFFVLVFLSVSIAAIGSFFGDSLLWLAVLIGDLGASLLVIINAMTVVN
jgi:Cd2+/Zn2+-exporting ATPase